jgi:hypothetical protein
MCRTGNYICDRRLNCAHTDLNDSVFHHRTVEDLSGPSSDKNISLSTFLPISLFFQTPVNYVLCQPVPSIVSNRSHRDGQKLDFWLSSWFICQGGSLIQVFYSSAPSLSKIYNWTYLLTRTACVRFVVLWLCAIGKFR